MWDKIEGGGLIFRDFLKKISRIFISINQGFVNIKEKRLKSKKKQIKETGRPLPPIPLHDISYQDDSYLFCLAFLKKNYSVGFASIGL